LQEAILMSLWRKLFGKSKEKLLTEDQRSQVEHVISRAYIDPYLGSDLISAQAIKHICQIDAQLHVSIVLNYPALLVKPIISEALSQALKTLNLFDDVVIDVQWDIPAHLGQRQEASRIKNIIAISSGKGGVGKSTTTVNLALALSEAGASVGILDADVYGPSQPHLLGIPSGTTPQSRDMRTYAPIMAYGLKLMSMGLMVTEKTPLMWRGPVASETIQQLINQTLWGDMDYLLVDMPPGTGDIHITLAQTLVIAGAVVVTTPQDIALLDVKKGIDMFNAVDVPLLGIIENMATHTCSHCNHIEHIFGECGGESIARKYHSEILGSLPLDIKIREQADAGRPIILAKPNSEIAKTYRDIALRLAVNVAQPGLITPLPKITFIND
jgi:ATP-binding protein involved in chromosome partitioning